MAEEMKKILIHTADGDHVVSVGEHKPKQTFGAMPVKDYVAAVADPDGLPQAGSVGAVVSALAAAMAETAWARAAVSGRTFSSTLVVEPSARATFWVVSA